MHIRIPFSQLGSLLGNDIKWNFVRFRSDRTAFSNTRQKHSPKHSPNQLRVLTAASSYPVPQAKFLVGQDGEVLSRYAPTTSPEDIEDDIKAAIKPLVSA